MHVALSLLLAAVTVATHTAYLAFDSPERVFYVLRGMEGVAVFVCLAWFTFRPTTRRVPTAVVFLSCIFGAYQEAMTAVCGLPYVDSSRELPDVDPAAGLCGAVTGFPLGVVELCLLAVSACFFVAVRYGTRSGDSY